MAKSTASTPVQLRLNGHTVEPRPGETVLDALLRNGVPTPFSCKGGICHTCMLRASQGTPPEASQRGLSDALKQQGYLLACRCLPDADLILERPNPRDLRPPRNTVEFPVSVETVGTGQTATRSDAVPASETTDREPPPIDPALWHELDDGRQVRKILEAFYAQVYQDPRLAPFFSKTTKERAIGQQYGFLNRMMTGDKQYFGEFPRNAHHWMVISDELMDARQDLMRQTLEAHGLTDSQIARWTRFEEHWRADMVKTAAFPKIQNGLIYPMEGYGRELLSSGTVCDHCGAEVPAGTEVLYHLRLGTISCGGCSQPAAKQIP